MKSLVANYKLFILTKINNDGPDF